MKKPINLVSIFCLIFLLTIPSKSLLSQSAKYNRPAEWAQSMKLSGINNLFKVNDDYYRGEQPTKKGFQELQKIGVKTIITLRTSNSDAKNLKGLTMGYEHIWFKTWHPEEEDILRFLTLATDPTKKPIFVHCRHGSDRTGMMTALYRIVVQGWSKESALQEMTQGGYGFHSMWKNLVDFIEKLDTDKLRVKLSNPKTP